MNNDNNESTGNQEFEEWANRLEHMTDKEVSYEIYQRIMASKELGEESRKLFSMAYEYCMKLINQGKPLEPNLLKIYLKDIKGQDISQINLINLFTLLAICGINFSKME